MRLSFLLLVGLVLIVLVLVTCIYGFFLERKLWNNGFSRECKTAWRYFDHDSQGGRGYRCQCRSACHTLWLCWPAARLATPVRK